MIPINPNDVMCDQADEGAALGLLGLMTGISEEFWCAGWMSGMEYDLWLAEPGKHYGQGTLSARQATLLRLLSEECGGWWYWHGNQGPKFITLDKWRDKIASRT